MFGIGSHIDNIPFINQAPVEVSENATLTFDEPAPEAYIANGVSISITSEDFTISAATVTEPNHGYIALLPGSPHSTGTHIGNVETYQRLLTGRTETVIQTGAGEHTITAQAVDGNGNLLPVSDTVTVTVNESHISFQTPDNGATSGSIVEVAFNASDSLHVAERGATDWLQHTGSFAVIKDGEKVAAGTDLTERPDNIEWFMHGFDHGCVTFSEPGEHTLTLQMVDPRGYACPDAHTITVEINPY